MSRKFSASCRVFRRGYWNCILSVQGNILTRNSFISNFFSILDTERFFWPILAKKSSGVVKTGFSVSMETFGCTSFAKPTECYFLEYRAEIFRLAVRKKSAGLSSCFLHLHGNFLKKKLLKSFCIFCGPFFQISPGNWAGKVFPVCQNLIHRIYKIISKKNSFGKQMKFFIIFRHWAGSFWRQVEFFDGDVGTALYVSKVTF